MKPSMMKNNPSSYISNLNAFCIRAQNTQNRKKIMNIGSDMYSIKISWSNIRKVPGIAILSLILLSGSAVALTEPPPALLEIGGKEQSAGIGDRCWKIENETFSICGDTFSIITPADALLTGSPFKAHLTLPLQETPDELGFSVIRVTDADAQAVNDFLAWSYDLKGTEIQVPSGRESDIDLSLEPGLYVFKVFARWEGKGDVTYGFLVKVSEPETKIAGFEFFLAITALLLAITIRRNCTKMIMFAPNNNKTTK